MLAYGGVGIKIQNSAGSRIKSRNDASRIRCNNAIGNGFKDIVHVAFVFFDLLDSFIQVSKEACVIDRNGGLIAEGQQQIAVFGRKEMSVNTAIDINRANAGVAHD